MSSSRLIHLLFVLVVGSIGFVGHGFSQNALDFDGIDDRVVAPNASALIANSNFSMALWSYPTNPAAGWPNFDGMAGFRNESNADLYILQLSSTSVEVRFRNSSGVNFTMAYGGLMLNTWNHFVATYDGSMFRLYHNGVAADSIAANGTITNSNVPFNIGTVPFGATNFDLDGRLEDVCLWSRALSAGEVNTWYNACEPNLADPGLQLCYQFNQGVAGANNTGITTLTDSKGNINANMSGFTLNGTTSNFIAHGNPTLTTINDSASCTYSYSSPSGTYVWDSTGIYYDTLTNSVGCDSIIAVNLTITTGALASTITVDECDFYISPSGNTWTSSGVYSDTLTSMGGCDSVITVNLTINQTSSATLSDTVCGSYISPSGITLTTSGTYPDTISNAIGCDSVLIINLTVNNADVSVTQVGPTLTSNASNAVYQWVNCANNFTAIPGQTNSSFTAAANGNYAVVVTQNGCTDTSACFPVVAISTVAPFDGLQVQAHPNPNSGRFSIQLPQVHQDISVQVIDATGRKIRQFEFGTTDKLDLEIESSPGLYFVELNIDGIKRTVKVVKQLE